MANTYASLHYHVIFSTKNRQEAKSNRQQREEELRWRKASLAREILNELWDDEYSAAALNMLDWDTSEYKIKPDVTAVITSAEVWSALRTSELDFNEKEKYVRDCFDALFSNMQITEHYIKIGLVLFEDVEFPYNYFARILAVYRVLVEGFLRRYEYDKALAFLNRLSIWNQAAAR